MKARPADAEQTQKEAWIRVFPESCGLPIQLNTKDQTEAWLCVQSKDAVEKPRINVCYTSRRSTHSKLESILYLLAVNRLQFCSSFYPVQLNVHVFVIKKRSICLLSCLMNSMKSKNTSLSADTITGSELYWEEVSLYKQIQYATIKLWAYS